MVILKLHDITVTPAQVIPFAVDEETTYRTHKYNGDDTLRFEIQRNHELYQKIFEEVKIEGFGNRFLVKQIDEHSDFVTVDCSLDYDEWKSVIFKDYRKTNEIISNVINEILPAGWTVIYGTGVDQTKRTTIEESSGQAFKATVALSILDAAMAAYGVVCNFDIIGKVLNVINPKSYTPSGEFIMEDLNLTELGFNGDSNDFITRLYPYGKKDETTGQYINIKSVNNNKEYIDNFQYSNKIVCGTWVDERYTVPQNLYDDAVKKLEELSRPQRSYTCNVINFNEDIWLYKVVTLIDKNRGQRTDHQVIEFVEYKNHRLDSCTLASKSPSITSIVQEAARNVDGKIEQAKSDIQQVIDQKTQQLSDTITGSKGGHFKWILDADGNPEELVNLYDSEDITRAQKVWRWNAGGLGHSNNGYDGTYDLALTKDGEINASMITTGILNAGLIRAGHMSADRIQGGSLMVGYGYAGSDIQLYSKIPTMFDANGNAIFYESKLTARLSELGISYYGYDYQNELYTSTGVTGSEFRGYIRRGPDSYGIDSSERVGTLNLARLDTINGQVYQNASLTANTGWLFLQSNYGQIFRCNNYDFFSFRFGGTKEYFHIETDGERCVLKTRGVSSSGDVVMYQGATGVFYDRSGNGIQVVNGLVVNI